MSRIFLMVVLMCVGCGSKKDQAPPPPAPATAVPAAPGSAAPAVNRAATFWKWFTEHAAELRAEKDLKKTMDGISAELETAYPGVFAEIGGAKDDRTLVLSVDGKKDLFPHVQELYAARPTVTGWTIVAFRQRAKPGDPELTIEMGNQKLDPGKVRFVGTPAGGKLDIDVFIPGFTTNEEMGQLGFLILDHAVGEFDMETKIGGIEFAALDKAPASAKPLAELPAMVDALK